MQTNVLYYGDNLDILRRYIPANTIDLVYLDPPFNSNRDYNVIFRDESGRNSDAQILAFEDTWHWGPSAEETYAYLTNSGRHQGRIPSTVSQIVAALRSGIGTNQMLAYLVEMAVRLVELHRVLKPTGSLYLHCDPTASHYLKLLLDAIFGPRNFRNEIVWKRFTSHNDAKQGLARYGRVHDVLLFYGKGSEATWNTQYVPVTDEHMTSGYKRVEPETGRRYMEADLTANKPGGDTSYEWKGVRPYSGRYWAYSKTNMEQFEAEGRLIYRRTGMPRLKLYLDELQGVPLQDVWTDVSPISAKSRERLNWNTQKPLSLLERIVSVSSNPGDVILDPFCGCGTALVAAQRLDRRWIGIDVTYLSIAVMRARLRDVFGLEDVEVIGQPTEVEGARALAQSPEGRYQFQWWALALVDAQPVGGVRRKGADQGIDGVITFTDKNADLQRVYVSVKSGHAGRRDVADLKNSLVRDGAAIGLFVTLEEPTDPMKEEATTAGIYHSELWNRDYPRVQILTIKELLEGAKPKLPPFVLPSFERADRIRTPDSEQTEMFG